MSLVAMSLLAVSLAAPSQTEMPADFLKVESKAWSRWLNEDVHVSGWTRVPLKDVLAGEFGAAALAVDNAKALETPVTFDADKLTRRAALWRLSRQYGFALRWAQKEEPRVFLGLRETEQRERTIGRATITTMTAVMRAEYKTYQELKRTGKVAKEEVAGSTIYYAVETDRDLRFDHTSAWVPVTERYKTTMPPGEVLIEARFRAKVKWIEQIGQRAATAVPVGADPRWLVGIEVLSIEEPAGPFNKKGEAVLAIHSPVKLFRDDQEKVVGKVYDFKVSGTMRDGRPDYHYAEARERKENERK
jgi:hypothetical protein